MVSDIVHLHGTRHVSLILTHSRYGGRQFDGPQAAFGDHAMVPRILPYYYTPCHEQARQNFVMVLALDLARARAPNSGIGSPSGDPLKFRVGAL